MANCDKSIVGSYAEQKVTSAAKLGFAERFSTVVETLPLAADRAHEDQEHVHKLRVATRRAAACLSFFRPCLPGKMRDSLKSMLREIRHAAGDARNLDVMAETLAQTPDQFTPTGLVGAESPLFAHLLAERLAAQQQLKRVRDAVMAGSTWAGLADLHSQVAWPERRGAEPHLAEHASAVLLEKISMVRVAANQDLNNLATLHAFRVSLKRLRYTVELGGCVLSPAVLKSSLKTLAAEQDRIGKINDHHTFGQIFERWKSLPEAGPGLRFASAALATIENAVVGELHHAYLLAPHGELAPVLETLESDIAAFAMPSGAASAANKLSNTQT